ncbi:carbohydrate ABC transporter permease [Jeotgalibaca ciconiae]|uniref:Sugar ABC transporter permease n=1 Tax=Jeotgalibaca ciconiae TaxID=2496265 RepID=A0A3S9HBF6_9LACT|nr:sugar ABC transporter permease [Jeotgalibaca ciconiae]AZP04503.1 sugar ABC transporter permease [Jeotgalibaca ciconiae]HJB24134.1 sugar ABC transporter permease [Candidatus Jeotgalibaca pullicola]
MSKEGVYVNKKKKRRISKKDRAEERQGYLFILPWIIGFIIFTAGPLLFSLYGSFTNYDITSRMDFVGFANYERLFSFDQLFKTSLYNTIYYVIFTVPITTVGAIFVSVLLNQDIPGMRFFRTAYYLPAVLSGVGVYILWMQLLDPSTGMVNLVLGWFGINGPNWLTDPSWTKNALILMKVWGVGGGMLMYLSSMQGISKTLYEAADIDGATTFQKFFKITIPMISPVIFFDVITSTIGGFQIFQEAYVMSVGGDGGPANSMLFYNLYMWNQAFESFNMGYAMAMSWILFAIIMVLTVINLRLGPRWVHYTGGEE